MPIKLFIGYRLSTDLKIRLSKTDSTLLQIPFEGKEYIGFYLEKIFPTIGEIRAASFQIMSSLQQACPELKVDVLSCVVLPQFFLG